MKLRSPSRLRNRIALAALTALGVGGFMLSRAEATGQYYGSRYSDVWGQVASDPYTNGLPHAEVTLASFFGFFQDHVLDASRRTLSDRSDLLPTFRKLLHPNGICLSGTWTITEETPYTGYFRKGSKGLFLGRASTALTNTTRGTFRSFGFAGKLFPTLDPDAQVETANFFTIEDLGGTLRDHFLDAENTNDILRVSPTPTVVWNTGVGAAAGRAFAVADQTLDITQVFIRQLYPIAELGEPEGAPSVAPRWMEITGSESTPRVDADDFRDELDIANYVNTAGGLKFDIRTADVGFRLGLRQWRTIGVIDVTATVASESCDHRLHFSHPKYRK